MTVRYSTSGFKMIDAKAKLSDSLRTLTITPGWNCSQGLCISFPDTPLHHLRSIYLLDCVLESAEPLTTFLKKSGGKLEQVVTRWSSESIEGWRAVIDAVQTSCRNLWTIIPSEGDEHLTPEVEVDRKNLLVSYGAQLISVDLPRLPIATCEAVLAQYPNVRYQYRLSRGVHSVDELDKFILLAPRVNMLTFTASDIGWFDYPTTRELFEAALAKITCFRCFRVTRHNYINGNSFEMCFRQPPDFFREFVSSTSRG